MIDRPKYCTGCHKNCTVGTGEIDPNCLTLRNAWDDTLLYHPRQARRRADGLCYLCLKAPAMPGKAVCHACQLTRVRDRLRERVQQGYHRVRSKA